VSNFVAARTTIVPHGVGHGRSAWQQDHAAHGNDARRHANPCEFNYLFISDLAKLNSNGCIFPTVHAEL
jgi:hypothetical protein